VFMAWCLVNTGTTLPSYGVLDNMLSAFFSKCWKLSVR